MSARSRRQLEPGLEPPAAFSGRHHEAKGLIPPSHFEVRCPGPPAVDTDPWAALSKATKDILELRRENERLRELHSASNRDMSRGRAGGEMDKVCSRARSLDQERAHKWPREATEQAEIITEQIREIHRLTGEARLLRSTVEQQATVIREKESLVTQLTEQLGEMRAELREQRREASQLQFQCQVETDGVQSQHQLEIQRLETQLVLAQAASSEEAEQLRSELKELRERYRHEVSALEEELAKQAAAKSEDNQLQIARLQDAQYQRMAEQILQLAESRDKSCAALKDRVSELEEGLRQSREKGQREAAHFREKLEAVTQERDTLQEDLRKTKLESESQNSVIAQLRTYIGQLVPDEKQLEESRQEKEQLNNKVQQHLEKEREALKMTAELMNIRLRSLNDILTIQESESSRKPKQGVPEGENVKRLPLVTRWREKVFTLMVQLKSQEISHANDINQLHVKLANLEEELRVKEQEQALLLHSFEDRTAEMNMERVQNQTLREELASAQSDTVRFQGNAERAENTLCHLKEVVSSFYQKFLEQETEQRKALCRLGNLGQRVTFANKRIDTIHGLLARKDAILRLQLQEKRGGAGSDTGRSHEDLEKELELLNRERDQLAAELKKTSQLIEKKVTEARLKCESELKDHLVVRGQLEEALEERTQCQQRLTEELRECQKQLADSQGAAESLRIELAQQQQKYEQALTGKVEEAEQRLAEQLSEMERQLNEARRGHTKAVVALRQTDRQAARDKERMQACEKLHEEQHQREVQRLSTKLRELERDRNLLVATLRQEGLLSRFRKSRAVAIQSTAALSDKEELTRPLADSKASKTSSQVQTKASLTEVLNELELLTASVIGDQEGEDTNEEEETK
ncbi:coiled-coil alpha-helical rod protein 1 isoform X4 [Chiloscyllium plagiosum]|uniref:coiled-coil alpha-helical rod protein 1 isoform X4 n=1 Tax=Chiloscyllium plagiosum TaxID=36176 RepID=UPI001CB7BCC1|nr:coiled-coil alpha-helical rod protein 1 isoform X4 [Chiloscyllium plagiosum]